MTLPNKATIDNYGNGVLIDELVEVNPESELNANDLNNLRNDTAAMTNTASICILQFLIPSMSVTTPVLYTTAMWPTGWDSVWGNNILLAPTVTYVGTGHYTVTLPASVPDQIGNTLSTNARMAKAWVTEMVDSFSTSIVPAFVIAKVTSSNTIDIRMYLANGSAAPTNGFVIGVEIK